MIRAETLELISVWRRTPRWRIASAASVTESRIAQVLSKRSPGWTPTGHGAIRRLCELFGVPPEVLMATPDDAFAALVRADGLAPAIKPYWLTHVRRYLTTQDLASTTLRESVQKSSRIARTALASAAALEHQLDEVVRSLEGDLEGAAVRP